MLNLTKVELELILDVVMYLFFELVWEAELITFPKDIAKSVINIWNLMPQNKNQNILYILIYLII